MQRVRTIFVSKFSYRINVSTSHYQCKDLILKSATLNANYWLLKLLFLFLGIPVAELSIDDPYSIESYLNNTNSIGPNDLMDFTLCFRFNVNYLKPFETTIFSYSTSYSDNTLYADLNITPTERLRLCFGSIVYGVFRVILIYPV